MAAFCCAAESPMPLSITIPPSYPDTIDAPLLSTINGSEMVVFVALIVCVVPLTVKFPVTVKLFATVTEASDPVSVSAVLVTPPSFTLNKMFPSSVEFVTWKFAED